MPTGPTHRHAHWFSSTLAQRRWRRFQLPEWIHYNNNNKRAHRTKLYINFHLDGECRNVWQTRLTPFSLLDWKLFTSYPDLFKTLQSKNLISHMLWIIVETFRFTQFWIFFFFFLFVNGIFYFCQCLWLWHISFLYNWHFKLKFSIKWEKNRKWLCKEIQQPITSYRLWHHQSLKKNRIWNRNHANCIRINL